MLQRAFIPFERGSRRWLMSRDKVRRDTRIEIVASLSPGLLEECECLCRFTIHLHPGRAQLHDGVLEIKQHRSVTYCFGANCSASH